MIPASNMGGGTCFAFPDVCKTPSPGGPVPIPYPNTGQNSQTDSGTAAKKVNICKKKAVVVGSKISMTAGDEPGSAGGVVSGGTKGTVEFLMGYQKVLIEGKVAAMLGSMTQQNKNNMVGAQIAPSQTKVLYSPVPVMPPGSASITGEATETAVEQLQELSQKEEKPHWSEAKLKASDGKPVKDAKVKITLPDGTAARGKTDANGSFRLEDIDPDASGDVVVTVL